MNHRDENIPTSVGNRATGGAGRRPYGNQAPSLTLGVAPVSFSDDRVRIGRIAPETQEHLKDLRREQGRTHAFRFRLAERDDCQYRCQAGYGADG